MNISLEPHQNPRIDPLKDAARLQWVIQFSQWDLDRLTAVALDTIGDDLLHAAASWWPHTEPPTRLTGAQVRALQRDIRQGIHALLSESISFDEAVMMSVGRKPLTGGWALPDRPTHLFRVRMDRRGRHTRVLAVGKEEDERTAIMGGVAALLGLFGDRLCACQVCGTPFLRHYRQEYCSVRCSNKVRNRRRLDRKSRQRKGTGQFVTSLN
jgi:hypothetical protein